MKKILLMIVLLLTMVSTSVGAQQKTLVLATGDSYTRQTPCSSTSYGYCDSTFQILHDRSYATYLNSATLYQVATGDNSGRGGDTCTTQEPLSTGPWTGQARGLLAQVNDRINLRSEGVVSILIGINDVNSYSVSDLQLANCLFSLYQSISGKKIIALTYPPISNTPGLWSSLSSGVAEQNRIMVNDVIRSMVSYYNSQHSAKIRLVDLAAIWSDPDVYTVDGAHPNAMGAILMAKKWWQDVCGGASFISNCYY